MKKHTDKVPDKQNTLSEFSELPAIEIQLRKSTADIVFEDISLRVKGYSLNECCHIIEHLGSTHGLLKTKKTQESRQRDISVG